MTKVETYNADVTSMLTNRTLIKLIWRYNCHANIDEYCYKQYSQFILGTPCGQCSINC